MKMKNRALVAIATLLMMGAMARPSFAQTQQIGVVDMDKLAQNYKRYTEADARVKAQIETLNTQLESRKLLDATEGARFDELIVKANRNKAEDDTLTALVKSGLDRNAELIGLNGKTRTPEEDARLKVLNDQSAGNVEAFRKVSDKVFSDMQTLMKTQEDEITQQFKDTIAKVAADRKLLLVVDTQFALWNAPGADITDEVLKRLNK
jgi:Skp family chaperone for outer membrane proteins